MPRAAVPLLLSSAAARSAAPAPTSPVSVALPGLGELRGVGLDGVDRFLGVPYAEAPVGDARWRAPSPLRWGGARDASRVGASCPLAGPGCGATAEDCLFLNVYAPSGRRPGAALPVMVWFHGGGYMLGCGSNYPGAALVENSASTGAGVVVVTVNYRLNVFGFLGSSQLAPRDLSGSTGNYGLQDQRLSLQWTRDHIAAFGGDPHNVLIFGQSAGAGSVAAHLVTQRSFGLYHKAVPQSGAAAPFDSTPLPAAEAVFAKLMRDVGCANVSCLVDTPSARIELATPLPMLSGMSNGATLPWGPVVDGVELLAPVWQLMRDGKVNAAVPVVLGSVRDELSNSLMLGDILPKMTEAEFDVYTAAYGDNAAKVKEIYRPGGTYPYPAVLGKYSPWWWAAMRSATDSTFICPARRAARWLVEAGAPAVYEYLYAHPPAPADAHAWGDAGVTVPHGVEVNYVFHCGGFDSMAKGSPELREYNCTFAEPEEEVLADAMSSYWLNFAATGDPNGAALPQWPKRAAGGDTLLRFDVAPAGIATQTGLRSDACDLFDGKYL